MPRFFYRCPIVDLGPDDRPPGMNAARGPSIAPVINRYGEAHRVVQSHPGAAWGVIAEGDGVMAVWVDIKHDLDVDLLLASLDAVAERVE